jgi:hypothetical protein
MNGFEIPVCGGGLRFLDEEGVVYKELCAKKTQDFSDFRTPSMVCEEKKIIVFYGNNVFR